MTRRLTLALIGILGLAAAQEPVIRGGVDLVDLLITVHDKKGLLVRDLEQSAFTVFEDGKQQEIRRFARETDLPLTIGMLVDTSGSVAEEMEEERITARRFFNQVLRPTDHAFVLSFAQKPVLLQDSTDSISKLHEALDELGVDGDQRPRRRFLVNNQFPGGPFPGGGSPFPGGGGRRAPIPGGGGGGRTKGPTQLGGTVLYDAVFLASDEVLKPAKNRKAIIIISDGEDRGSIVTEERAIEAAIRSDVIVYSIYVKPDRRGAGNEEVMERLATETGGRMFRLERRKLEQIFNEISDELRSQYSLSYSSSNEVRDGRFRRIEVRVADKNLKAQTRSGYYAR